MSSDTRVEQAVQKSLYESYSPELKDLFGVEYDLKAPFGENIKKLNNRKRNHNEGPLNDVSDGSQSRKRRKTTKKARTREQSLLDRPGPTLSCYESPADEHQQKVHTVDNLKSGRLQPAFTTNSLAKDEKPPPKAPKALIGLERSADGPRQCQCTNLARYFTSAPNRIPTLRTWPGHKKAFFKQIRKIASCQGHPAYMRKACADLLDSPNNGFDEESTECWTGVDLVGGLYSGLVGRYKVNQGRAQSSIAPGCFYNRQNTPIASFEMDSIDNSPGYPVENPNQQSTPSHSKRIMGHIHPDISISFAENGAKGDKKVEDVIDWAMNCLGSQHSSQPMQQDVGLIEDEHSTYEQPDQPLPNELPRRISPRSRRYQSVPARLMTPAPLPPNSSETPRDRVKDFARDHLNKVPNLSINDIKRIVEELDRRLTNVEGNKNVHGAVRSNDGPEAVIAPHELHYSTRQGFTNAPSASVSHTVGWTPVNPSPSVSRGSATDANTMPPPPIPPRKKRSIAEQKLSKPEFPADVPREERLPEAEIIDLGRRKVAYDRHKSAPYAFTYRGKLHKEYRHLLTKVGQDGKTVWISEEVARLS